MVSRKKVGGGKRFKAASKAKESGTEPQREGPAPPKHVQRKVARKVGFLDKVAASRSPLLAARTGVQKKKRKAAKQIDLHSLSATLEELTPEQGQVPAGAKQASGSAARKFGEKVKSAKARSMIQVQETARMQQVMQHSVYKVNPFQAIANHLNATLPPAPAKAASAVAGQGSKGQTKKKKRQAQQLKVVAMDDSD